jgi:hypothetical protein
MPILALKSISIVFLPAEASATILGISAFICAMLPIVNLAGSFFQNQQKNSQLKKKPAFPCRSLFYSFAYFKCDYKKAAMQLPLNVVLT